jgi:hypothetical protein
MDKYLIGIALASVGALSTLFIVGGIHSEVVSQCNDWVFKNYEPKSWDEYYHYEDICIANNWIVIEPPQLPTIVHIKEPAN